jgi:TPR repeat protein
MLININRLSLSAIYCAFVAITLPPVSAQMSQEELRIFEDHKAKAIKGDGQATSIVATGYLSGKVIPDDKAEALALCLCSIGYSASLPKFFQQEEFKKLFGGMPDDLMVKGIKRSFEIKKAGQSLRSYERISGHEERPGPWHGNGLQALLEDIYISINAKGKEAMNFAKDFIKEFQDRMTRIAQATYDGYRAEQLRIFKRRADSYLKAAERGGANAQVSLGYAYQYGRGVASDAAEAVKWHRQAADQGNSDGQRALGYCYQDGVGVAKDEIEAFAYWTLAGAKDAEARGKLADLEKRMTPAALSRGRQRSTELQREIEAKIAAKKPGK